MNKKILPSIGFIILLGSVWVGTYQFKTPSDIQQTSEIKKSQEVKQNKHSKKNHKNIQSPDNSKPQKIFIALGDSLTEGYQLDSQNSYPRLLEARLNKEFPKYKTQVVNAGISGSTTSSGTARLKKYLHLNPLAVLISLGSNDGLRGTPIDLIKKNLQNMIDLALANKISVLLAGLKLPVNYGESYRRPFEKIFKDLSRENKITLIPFLLKGVAGNPEFNLPDLIHPNEEGHKIMMQTLYPYFKKFYE